MAVATYLADKSAYARLHQPVVLARLGPMIERGLVATCSLVDLELLFSTRSAQDYDDVLFERRAFERLEIEQVDWDRAVDVQRELAHRSMNRAVGTNRRRRGRGTSPRSGPALRPGLPARRSRYGTAA